MKARFGYIAEPYQDTRIGAVRSYARREDAVADRDALNAQSQGGERFVVVRVTEEVDEPLEGWQGWPIPV